MRFVHPLALRWSDMDAYGHINNSRFLTLYEEARVALFFKGTEVSFADGVVIARHEIDYLRFVDYADPVRVELWVEDIRAARFTVAYEMCNGEAVVSRARSVCVPFQLAQGHPRRLTEAEREFLAHWS